MGIYKQPTFYKCGDSQEIEIHESILDYANDWVDVSNDFQLASNAVLFKDGNEPGTITDLNAKLSKSKKLLYFDSRSVRVARTTFDNSNWNFLLKYVGNEIKFNYEGGSNPFLNYLIYPKDVNRGTSLFYMVNSNNGGSTSDYCLAAWIGSDISNTYLSIKRIINNGTNGTGFVLGQLCFEVDLK